MRTTLPVTLDLHPEETLEAYLERTAAANSVSNADLTHLLQANMAPAALRFARVDPHPSLIAAITRLTAADPGRLRAATLARYDGGLPLTLAGIDHTMAAGLRPAAARGWLQSRTTQVCPPCLAVDGTWRVSWRLLTTVACTTHRCHLATTCPGCGQRFRDTPHTLLRPHSSEHLECGNPTSAHGTCSQDLTGIAVQDTSENVVAYQRDHDTATTGAPMSAAGLATTAATYLAATRSIAVLLMHLNEPDTGRRWGIAPPADTNARADALAQAHRVLAAASYDIATRRLRTRLAAVPSNVSGRPGWVADHLTPSRLAAQIAGRALAPALRLRHQLRTLPPSELALTAVPQVVPAHTYDRHAHGAFNTSPVMARAFCAIAIAAHLTQTPWSQAAQRLGIPAALGQRISRTVLARPAPNPDSRLDLLTHLLEDLPPDVDYRQREHTIRALLPNLDWYRTWAREHRSGAHSTSAAYALTWIWTEVAGAHLLTSPAWPQPPDAAQRAAHRQYAHSLTPTATAALLEVAAA